MKTPTQLFLHIFTILLISQNVFSQSTSVGPGIAGHTGTSTTTDWCGWQNNLIPFNIEHRGTKDINFFTGGTQRMTIRGTGAGATTGFVGIGTSFSTPSSLLHINGGTASFPSLTVQGTDPASGVNGLQMIASGHQYNIGVGGASNGTVPNKLFFYDNTVSQFRMVIDTDGNVDIYEKKYPI